MREHGIPHIRRPFEALSEWTREHACSIRYDSPTAKAVFEWFEERSPQGSHAIGSMFSGVYYFDAYFWKVSIPIAYGTVGLDARNSIENLPDTIRKQIMEDRSQIVDYLLLWVDILDYAYGIDDLLRSGKLSGYSLQLSASADTELRATVRLLTESRQASPKAMESARMTTEKFLKAYLAAHAGLTDTEARKRLSHDLSKAAKECKQVKGQVEFDRIGEMVKVFPVIGSRYGGDNYDSQTLWLAYCVAQFSATAYIRSLTDRDSRAQMFPNSASAPET
jgi:hypothetical protein